MKQIIHPIYRLIIFAVLLFTACKKDANDPVPLSSGPANLSYVVNGNSFQITWNKPDAEFDHYTIELSKSEDFFQQENSQLVDADQTQHIFRNLDPAQEYFVRIRADRENPGSSSEWSSISLSTYPGNILEPIKREDIAGNTVSIKWDFSTEEAGSNDITKVILLPAIGQSKEIALSDKNKQDKMLLIDGLVKDMSYTVRIYHLNFLRGSQLFSTPAESVNGVWTLNPYSDLKAAVEASKNGDKIVLRPGVYNFWSEEIMLSDKAISIESADPAQKAKVYVKSFVISGLSSSLALKGLDMSGSRVNSFKTEIPNTADTRWNSWLIKIAGANQGFNQISFDNCIVRNYYTGLLEMLEGQTGELLTINNCIVHHTGGDNLEGMLKTGTARLKKGVFTNSTYHKTNKMFIAVDREKNLSNDIDFLFKNNTVDNSWSAMAFDFKASKRPTVVRLENNIFTNMNTAGNFFGNFAHVANDFDKRLINCNFYNVLSKSTIYGKNLGNMQVYNWELRHPNNRWNEVVPAFAMNDASHENPNSIKEYPVNIDPQYADPANLNFKIPASNPLRNLAAGTTIGDPRWW